MQGTFRCLPSVQKVVLIIEMVYSCIFLELFARRPVFQGQDEIHQLEVIFKVTGTPSVENWPGVQDLPWYELVKPKTTLPSQLRSVFSK